MAMKRTLTAPECMDYFFRTREKFNARVVGVYSQVVNAHCNFMGYRVTYCRYLLKMLPERIAMVEFLLEHFDCIPDTLPIHRDYLECDHAHLLAYRDKVEEYLRNPYVYR